MDAAIVTILDAINRAGVVGLLVLILVGGWKRWWVFGWQHDLVIKDRDEWKGMALTGTQIAKHMVDQQTEK